MLLEFVRLLVELRVELAVLFNDVYVVEFVAVEFTVVFVYEVYLVLFVAIEFDVGAGLSVAFVVVLIYSDLDNFSSSC